MEEQPEFVDLLIKRRQDCDILWASRSMDLQFPHKLPEESKYTREQMINAILCDNKIKQAIPIVAALQNISEAAVTKQIRAMVHEMASKGHLYTVRWLSIFITKAMKRIFSSIYINQNILLRLKKEMQIFQVQYIYAPSHRSYLDFILMSYILFSYDMALPNIASGMDFYQMFIVGELLRHTGAFFMRRSFSNDVLYKTVFRTYVTNILAYSARAIEFFIEGTRSRSLKSIVPKYGLLSNILEGLLDGKVPDVYFVPISISYERPPEELLFVYELLGVPKPKESTIALFRALSILKKPHAYGRVFFNIGEPVSACQFLTTAQRKARVLSPHAKLDAAIVEELAYYLIDTHKRNTVLIHINLIAFLFNERIQMQPDDPYTLETLIEDYVWYKSILTTVFNAVVSTKGSVSATVDDNNDDKLKAEILHSLRTHEELLCLDTSNVLRIVERHKETKSHKRTFVRGHMLSVETMQSAVPSINLCIYMNPVLSLLIKPAIAVIAVGLNRIAPETAFNRYSLLRTLLSTEFALPLIINETRIDTEWEQVVKSLLKENCLSYDNGLYGVGQNEKLHSLLYNALVPYIDAIYITCVVLFEWDESTLNYLTNRGILAESQKRAEAAFLENNGWGKHPYSLSLDLYNSTLSNLLSQGIIVMHGEREKYRADKIRLAKLMSELTELQLRRPPGSYINLNRLPVKQYSKL